MSIQDDIFDVQWVLENQAEKFIPAFDRILNYLNIVEEKADRFDNLKSSVQNLILVINE